MLEKDGLHVSEAGSDFGDDYRWSLGTLGPTGTMRPEDIDCTVTLTEEREYEGTEEEGKGGVTFAFDVVQVGSGRIVAELKPFNYSDQVWVALDDAAVVEERWGLLEDADYSTLSQQIRDAVGEEVT